MTLLPHFTSIYQPHFTDRIVFRRFFLPMELFTGDRHRTDFPEDITPFPELYDHRAAVIHPPEVEIRPQLPPQKLRPIRCNGRNPAEYSYPPATGDLPENGGLVGNLINCGMASPEVGFLTHPPPLNINPLNGEPKECPDSPANFEIGELPERGGGIAGYRCPKAEPLTEFGSEMNAEYPNPNPSGRVPGSETESSSSSDDGGVSSGDITEPVNRKRKRKTRKKLEIFLENLIMKVIEKQEQMHKQLIEMVEKREKERIIREEAWKQQEMVRAKRNEEVRAQETSRSLALISFIQNVLGHEIQIPKSVETSCQEEDESEIHNQKDFKYDPSSARWPKSEVQALITLRTALDHKFRIMGPKGSIWEEISVGLSNMGYSRTAKKCKEKWENINKYYKKSMGSGKKRPENAKTCPYFHELDVLYKNGLINLGNAPNNMNGENEDRSVE